MLSYLILIPESPRWDLNYGNIEKARNTFLNIAKWNKIDVTKTNFENNFQSLKERTKTKQVENVK